MMVECSFLWWEVTVSKIDSYRMLCLFVHLSNTFVVRYNLTVYIYTEAICRVEKVECKIDKIGNLHYLGQIT